MPEGQASSQTVPSPLYFDLLGPTHNASVVCAHPTAVQHAPHSSGMQFWLAVGATEAREALVVDHTAREADQDRSQGGDALGVRDLPDGRGGGPARLVRGDPGPHPAVRCAAAVGAAWLTHVPERTVGDSSGGQRLMLRRNGMESLFPRRRGQDCNPGAPGEQPRRNESPRERVFPPFFLFLLESSGSLGYDHGLKSDNWEIPA